MPSPISLTSDDGVARLEWDGEVSTDELRREVASALTGHSRVEVLVDVDDAPAQRAATWAGLHREGVRRGLGEDGGQADLVVYARLVTDTPVQEPGGFRALLNSFLPRKRAISQMLVRDPEGRVLLCQLTYKRDWDLPGGVVEVGESPRLAVQREVEEELGLEIEPGELVLTDWLPPWGGWDDAVCLVFDGGTLAPSVLDTVVKQEREIRDVRFCTLEEVDELAADFTARRVRAAVGGAQPYTESGR
ncbi:8-oxo-dGTP pyrophosphatase MutT (NUDIX family) [Nocardioides cavernae]|uniref:8-oxo-dGTP pyrophosphatase MutT (NUDIX family) n=1 Tax=Nocardioides cavernae TaxID=1921566 RepID=A0A7Y9H4G8_9ACTN|nr:NUDIX hydrolase [Nocardioides cavernae]NYE37762.1 8-oxo-dGTP pyrophosphatase MutT (NUDIX family) [Nocardioides cavernae]